MQDPIEGLADMRLLELYGDLLVQLEKGTGTRPVLWLLNQQRKKAVVAFSKLIEIDASEQVAIRALQSEIRLYSDLIESCKALLHRGKEADRKISEDDRSEFERIIATPEQEQLYGINQRGLD